MNLPQENSNWNYEDPDYVQTFLTMLEPGQKFHVIFHKKDDTQGEYKGNLDPDKPDIRSSSVAMQTDEGWKRFNLDRVLYIGYC